MRIGYLEDDLQQANMVKQWLADAGHECRHFERGAEFVQDVRTGNHDLLLMDWELPDISGIEALTTIRASVNQTIPVLFCTQRDAEEDVVRALEAGADDYMVKPIRQGELKARIDALARRAGVTDKPRVHIELGPYRFDISAREAYLSNQPVTLTEKDFDLAICLFNNVGRVLSRKYLLETIWGVTADVNTRTVDVHISRIRKSLNISPENGYRIKTVYQHGYRLEATSQD
ncbi:MAG: response regulator transcription factor [Ketobacteraceae bacterium]|nr:response regulator transcription factor [Ketobacteraceae bacterium]